MLKKDNKIRNLERYCSELKLDIDAIEDEHSFYRMNSSQYEAMNWFDCLPIETLKESINREKGRPREKYSLKDLYNKFKLERLYSCRG